MIAIADSNPSVVYIGTDGGIWRSTDSGLTWTSLNNIDFHATQFQSLALHPTDRQFLIGGTQDNGTQFLKPDGTWLRADAGDGGYRAHRPERRRHDRRSRCTTPTSTRPTRWASPASSIPRTRRTTAGPVFGCGFGGFVANGITCAASAIQFYAPMALGPGSPNTSTSAPTGFTARPTQA